MKQVGHLPHVDRPVHPMYSHAVAACFALCAANTHECMKLLQGGDMCLVQVAMTDLEDVVDKGWPMEDMCDM